MREIIKPEQERRAAPFASTDDTVSTDASEAIAEREGLPRSYRMRADQHYVDQLSGPSGQPVRMVPLAQIDADAPPSNADLRPLIESIRAHGIVQPLILRRQDSRFRIVAGRKRFAAAQLLKLATVPSLVHELTDTAAAALRAADNLRIEPPAAPERAEPRPSAHRLLAAHVSAILGCAAMPDAVGGLNRPALELLKAHASRAARVLAALDLIDNAPMPVQRENALATVVSEVVEGFDPECRLCGVTLRIELVDAPSASGINGAQLAAGLSGALMAMLPLVERTIRPTLWIRVSNRETSALVVEVSQADAPVSPALAARFFDAAGSIERPGGNAAALGAAAAKALAAAYGGDATFEATEQGSRLTIVMNRRS